VLEHIYIKSNWG